MHLGASRNNVSQICQIKAYSHLPKICIVHMPKIVAVKVRNRASLTAVRIAIILSFIVVFLFVGAGFVPT